MLPKILQNRFHDIPNRQIIIFLNSTKKKIYEAITVLQKEGGVGPRRYAHDQWLFVDLFSYYLSYMTWTFKDINLLRKWWPQLWVGLSEELSWQSLQITQVYIFLETVSCRWWSQLREETTIWTFCAFFNSNTYSLVLFYVPLSLKIVRCIIRTPAVLGLYCSHLACLYALTWVLNLALYFKH